jgi:molybdate/tungstate transport system substrate-binding protein
MKLSVRHIWLLAVLSLSVFFAGCGTGEREKTELVIFNAGSLVIPMEKLEAAFEEAYPDIDMRYEGHGSIQVVRHTTEIRDSVDLAFVADYSLLPLLMYPAEMEDGSKYADWHIRFATNQLGIAYTPESAYADEINADNWYEIFRRDDVNIGFSDPRLDAVGYRSLMLLQLAEDYYHDVTIFDDIIFSNFKNHIRSVETDGDYSITVPELLESTNDRIYLRGFSVQLLALLESNQIDYGFEYESVAIQHGLKFLPLPDEINLSKESLADNYARITVKLDYNRYKTVTPVFRGLPIIYGVTIPNSALHPDEAVLFLEFLFGEQGQAILAENHQPSISPAKSDNPAAVPDKLKKYLE